MSNSNDLIQGQLNALRLLAKINTEALIKLYQTMENQRHIASGSTDGLKRIINNSIEEMRADMEGLDNPEYTLNGFDSITKDVIQP